MTSNCLPCKAARTGGSSSRKGSARWVPIDPASGKCLVLDEDGECETWPNAAAALTAGRGSGHPLPGVKRLP